jgi:hypothetical protein
MATPKKRTTTAKKSAPARRRAPAKKTTTRRRAAPRKKPVEASFMPLLFGIGGALAAKYAAQNSQVVKLIPDAKIRMLAITGLGVAATVYGPEQFRPAGIGMAIGGGVTAIELFLQGGQGTPTNGIGRISTAEVRRLKQSIQQHRSRINGTRPVMTGARGVIVGGWDGN